MDFERNYQIKILSKSSSIKIMGHGHDTQRSYSLNIISLFELQSIIIFKLNLKVRRYRSYTTIKIVVPRCELEISNIYPNVECKGLVGGYKTPNFISYKLLTTSSGRACLFGAKLLETRFYSATSKKSCSTTEYRDLQLDP